MVASDSGRSSDANATAGPHSGDGSGMQSGPEQKSAPDQSFPLDKVAVLGHAVWLMTRIQSHRHFFISDLEWALLPPIANNQFRLWREQNVPLAFATWASVSPEVEERLLSGNPRLAPADWASGDRLWLMDLLAPFGQAEAAAQELKEQVFKGQVVKTLKPAPNGQGVVAGTL